MRDVAIIGAGELGGALAHILARRDAARILRLIDQTGSVAAGKALDIAQAAPLEPFTTTVVGSTDLSTAGGSAIVVVADRANAGEWHGEEGLKLLRQLTRLAPGAIILCAGASQRELVERGARELHIARLRVFGSAPEALAGAVRAIVALEAGRSPREVALTILGVPPDRLVVPWEDATIGGIGAARVLDDPARRRVAARVAALWPPGPYALAAAAARVVEAVLGRSRRSASCFVAPDDSGGRRMRAAALPVGFGPGGIVRAELPPLSVHERVALDNAMML